MKRLLQIKPEYERNGYHDSYFFVPCVSVTDDGTMDRIDVEVGATAYGPCTEHNRQICFVCAGIEQPTAEELLRIAVWTANDEARAAEAYKATYPTLGAAVQFTGSGRKQSYKAGQQGKIVRLWTDKDRGREMAQVASDGRFVTVASRSLVLVKPKVV